MDICVFCNKIIEDDYATLGWKGILKINQISEKNSDTIQVHKGQKVHIVCRSNYTKPTTTINNNKELVDDASQVLESAKPRQLDEQALRDICFYCSRPAKLTECRKRGIDVHRVQDAVSEASIRKCIEDRNDKWSSEVIERIGTSKLIGATYHQPCSVRFRLFKDYSASDSHKRIGRPQDRTRDAAFLKICDYMANNEGEVFSMSELCDQMRRECGENADSYSYTYFKQRLIDHFGDNIVITQMSGSKTLVLFRYSVDHIISDFHKANRNLDREAEKKRIIQASSKLILSDILSMQSRKEEYPHPEDLSNLDKQFSFLPTLLSEHLMGIIKSKNRDLKIVGIGQAIVQAARPRGIISPVQIGLGVQMHHHFASKFLIQCLNKLGFCSSYKEVQTFELSAAAKPNVDDVDVEENPKKRKFAKWVADNVDHDTRTLDGKNTFHGMGLIAAFTPGNFNAKAVKRATNASIDDVRAKGTIPILPYEGSTAEKALIFGDINVSTLIDPQKQIDFLLSITWGKRIRPSWAGMMQSINHGTHTGKSSITILPMIDLNPSDFTCINSTLHYVANEAKKNDVSPVLTFDSPLWWKAQIIISNEPVNSPLKKIVLLLGGFHTVMSFMGCIGSLMEDMGLQETLETIYASNSVAHMLSGKAFSRALRGHLIVDMALNTLLTREIAPNVLNEENAIDNSWSDMLSEVDDICERMINKTIGMDEVNASEILDSVNEKLEHVKQVLSKDFRTSRLWFQYADMIQLLRSFIRSERTGQWSLHLAILRKMHPYFPAAGHNHYAKCIYVYLQQMEKLKDTNLDVYNAFSNGDFIIRRSERYWGAVSCDQTIEQSLMRNVKSSGGMTRGRGIDEKRRLIWIHSMPDCIEMNGAMQKLTELHFETSEQHKDCGTSRQRRDHEDTQRVFDFLKERNPFQRDDHDLRNICNGMKADGKVNVDDAAKIGEKIISSMAGQNVEKYSFKKANSVMKVNAKNAVVIDGEIVTIDPQLLFQRLMLITKDMDENQIQSVFKYELSQKPSALFDEYGFLREANNQTMYDTLWKKTGHSNDTTTFLLDCQYILNGHSLINKIPWQKNETFDNICLKYIQYVSQYERPTVVFESSYDLSPCINDELHLRRTKGIPGKDILFTGNMLLNCKKESFLANRSNTQRFINFLGKVLQENNCTVIFSPDPVATIAKTAVESAITRETVVLGGDIKTLVVLCHNFGMDSNNIWLKADEKKANTTKLWNIGKMNEILGREIMQSLIFIHVIMGSDGTSHLFGISTATALKKFESVKSFRDVSYVFLNGRSEISEIENAGKKAMCILYNGNLSQELNSLRYQRFLEKVSSRTSAVQVQTLPPTEAATRYHSLRTYYQIQTLLGQKVLDPLQFGWELKVNMLRAKTTDLAPAPAELLSRIRCSCKGNCDTKRCNCQKHGLKCTSACGECKGINCLNNVPFIIDDDEYDDDEEVDNRLQK